MAVFNVGDKVWLTNVTTGFRRIIESYGMDSSKPFKVLTPSDTHGYVSVGQWGGRGKSYVRGEHLTKEDPSVKVVDGDITGETISYVATPFVSVDNLRRANKWIGIDPAELDRLIELAGELK